MIEDLSVAGMTRNRSLARHIADQGWGEFRRQLTYKAAWYGAEVVVADRWLASSKTCSRCGTVKAALPLSVRTFRCDDCGLALDRDFNAARNLAARAVNRAVAVSATETLNACGGASSGPGNRRDETGPREAGTRQPTPAAA